MAYTKCIVQIIVLTLLFPLLVASQTEKFIQNNTTSINKKIKQFTNEDFKFLDNEFSNTNLFIIGETSHDSGLSYDFEYKLVKYLHQKHGFNVLLMEDINIQYADYFSNKYLKYNNSKVDSSSFFKYMSAKFSYNQLFLFKYVLNSKWTENPIKINGLSINVDFVDSLSIKLNSHLRKYYKNKKELNSFDSLLLKIKVYNFNDTFLLKRHITLLSNRVSEYDFEGLKFLQVLKNCREHIRTYSQHELFKKNISFYKEIEMYKNRDAQMADDVLFFINKYYKDKKVIVITTLYHSLKNIDEYREQFKEWKYAKPMCTILAEKGIVFYNLGILCNKGYCGRYSIGDYIIDSKPSYIDTTRENGRFIIKMQYDIDKESHQLLEVIKLPNKHHDSIEILLENSGVSTGFINFKQMRQSSFGNNIEFVMQPLFDTIPVKRNWTKSYDGIFFINEMKPVREEFGLTYPIPKDLIYDEDDFPVKQRKVRRIFGE